VFKSGSFERLAVPLSLVARLEEIPLASVEHAGGRRVVQYRNQILPLIALSSFLDQKGAHGTVVAADDDPLRTAQSFTCSVAIRRPGYRRAMEIMHGDAADTGLMSGGDYHDVAIGESGKGKAGSGPI
jgi:chemotaxis protein histidine kinase CheA